MKTKRFQCRHCRRINQARVKGQKYCGGEACQRARKRDWRREKRSVDPDYRANQRASNEKWLEFRWGAAAYHREYRRRRKASAAEKNAVIGCVETEGSALEATSLFAPELERIRKSAKSDATPGENPIKSGRYVIFPESAKSDAILVKISFISSG